jgi:hypothetical protein
MKAYIAYIGKYVFVDSCEKLHITLMEVYDSLNIVSMDISVLLKKISIRRVKFVVRLTCLELVCPKALMMVDLKCVEFDP